MELRTSLQSVPPRALLLAGAALLALGLLAGYLYLFKGPLAEARQLRAARLLLETKVQTGAALGDEIARQQAEVERLTALLQGEEPELPVNEMVAYIIGRMDDLCALNRVRLLSVKPGLAKQVPRFEEVPIVIEVAGDYFDLYAWLNDVEDRLGPMVVKRFAIRPLSGANDLRMELDMVSYRSERGRG